MGSLESPADVYQPSTRRFPEKLATLSYPQHDDVLPVSPKGLIWFDSRTIYLGAALAGETVGVREEDDGRWLVTFIDRDLGHLKGGRFEALSPLGEK
jgi:hypothetical protein